jgi:hypothetical protein
MKRAHVPCASLLAALAALALLAPACSDADPADPTEPVDPASYVVGRDETLSGKSYEDLAAEWWQWARAIPQETNPVLDGPCGENQSGPVFFLAGTFGETVTRSRRPGGHGALLPS